MGFVADREECDVGAMLKFSVGTPRFRLQVSSILGANPGFTSCEVRVLFGPEFVGEAAGR